MSFLISNFVFSLIATFLFGLFISWIIWGRNKNKYLDLVADWQDRYTNLENEYRSIASEFNELEAELSARAKHTSHINDEKNELTGKLTASKALLNKADKEIEHLKKQLGQTTLHLQTTTNKLDEQKQELAALKDAPDETQELKMLLGEATKRYNENGLELKNQQEQYVALENKFDETTKRMTTLNKELVHLRAGLLKSDKEFKNQIVLFSNLQNQYDEKNKLVANLQKKLTSQQHIADDNLKEAEIAALQNELANKNEDTHSLNEKINHIESVFLRLKVD